MTSAVRTRGKELLRAELADAASRYCAEHGFNAVTVEEVSQSIGISRATFFRYFASKEDAVVTASSGSLGFLARAIAATASQPGESAWRLVRRSVQPTLNGVKQRGEDVVRARIRMINATPSLKARLAWSRREEQTAIEEVLSALGSGRTSSRAVAAAAVAALDLAWQDWADSPDSDLDEVVNRWFEALAAVDVVTTGAAQ